ncbi:MAG: hypothetical protein AB8I08_12600 [Sandaracinaceae bacterium]
MRPSLVRTLLPLSALLLLPLLPACEGALAIEAAQTGPGGSTPRVDLGGPMGPPPMGDAGPGLTDSGTTVDGGGVVPIDEPPLGCTPQCAGRECGDDGCGGSCGSCNGTATCSAAGTCQAQSAMCPPTGSTGTSVGQVSPDFSVPLAEGGEISVRSICANGSAMIYRYTASCGICRRWMADNAEALYQELRASGFEMVILVGNVRRADGSYGPPDAASASAVRSEFGLTMPVAYETNNEMLWTLSRSGAGVALLMTEGNVIAAPIGKVSDSTVRSVASES